MQLYSKFYLYQTQWRKEKDVLHFFPHWTWPNLKETEIPVVCYTSYPKAELFVNGKSYGVRTKTPLKSVAFEGNDLAREASGGGNWELQKAYSIVWDKVTYEPGEIKIVAYNEKGKVAATEIKRTAGEPFAIKIESELPAITAGEVGVYVVSVVDKDGNLCPHYNENMKIEVSGAAEFLASGNGDPTNMQNLSKPERKFLNGQAVLFVQSNNAGNVVVKTNSGKLQASHSNLMVK